ncbi:hypothetical protein [Nitrosopumilus sp.]|uniref:hypothetical protein n=2 Tax=Nitrosopumilus sp. TaxID=2024843 RepID=UPI0034A05911
MSMVIPIIVLITIPVFLGIAYVTPFDQPEEIDSQVISEDPDVSILYFILMVTWAIFLLRILLKIKKGTFKVTQRY